MTNDKKDRVQLKTYFKSNATPTEQNFKDLIDANLNQKEDGILKIPSGPIGIQSVGATEEVLHFYKNFTDKNPSWMLSQRADSSTGFSLSTGEGVNKLFIDAETGKMGIGGITAPNGGLHIYENTGSEPTALSGSLILEHGDPGGQSSIVFKSKVNAGSDMAYICFQDNVAGGSGESTLLTIGSRNDPDDHLALMPGGHVGIGTTRPTGRLHIFVDKSSPATSTTGSLVLEHGNAGGQSSIVFKSKVNEGSDYGYISYQDDAVFGGSGERSILTIGTQNDADDHIAIMPSGNLGIGRTQPVTKVDVVAGSIIGTGDATQNEHAVENRGTKVRFGALVNEYVGMDVIVKEGTANCGNSADLLFVTWECNTSVSREVMRINGKGNVGIGTDKPTGRLHIFEQNGTPASSEMGSLVLEHGNPGGQSSIVFKSRTNKGSDFAYINYQDDSVAGGAGEQSVLTIGVQNDANDHIALMPSGNVGVGIQTPEAKLHVVASGANNPSANGIYLYNPTAAANQDAILAARVNGAGAGNPFISLDVAGVTGWSIGLDNKDSQSLKFANTWNNLGVNTRMTLQKDGSLGLGITRPAGRLHIFEEKGTVASNLNGSIVLEHGNKGGQSSIVFRSKNNGTSDYGYISYQDDTQLDGEGELGVLTIGIQNDYNDHIALMSSGNVGVGTANPQSKLDIAGGIRIADGTQGQGKILTSDANGFGRWVQPAVRRDFRPYGTPSYIWDGTDALDVNGLDPQSRLSNRNAGAFGKYNGFIKWGSKCMFGLNSLSQEAQGTATPPQNGVYLTLPATAGVHNALLLSTIDYDRWSIFTVWLCDANGNSAVKIARSSNNANNKDVQASSYLLGPRNSMKETKEHAWMTFPITAQQVGSYISGGNLKFIITSGPSNSEAGALYLSGFSLVPNPYGFMQHPGLTLHWGGNSNVGNELTWHSIWQSDGLIQVPANTTNYAYVKVVDPDQDLLVTFHEHNNGWYGGSLLINVGGDKTIFSPSLGLMGIAPMVYNSANFMRPQSIWIPKEIVKAQLITTGAAVPSMLQLKLRNTGVAPYHFRGIDTEIFY